MDLKPELEERLIRLISLGKQAEGTSPSIDINKLPACFKLDRFQRAQKVVQKYYTNISLASSTGLILILQTEGILIPLLKTGKSRTVMDLYDRYVPTAVYMRSIYETNFYEPTSEGWKNLVNVRGMHKRIHKIMKEDPTVKQDPPNVWVNQFDMALTQFAFIGLFLLYPDKCGAYKISKQEISDVVYYWRLISYYFGIEDDFDLFAYDELEDIGKELEYLRIFSNYFNNELLKKPRIEVGVKMGEGFMLAFDDLLTNATFNILDHWWSPMISLSGEVREFSSKDKWRMIFFEFLMKVLFKSEILLEFMNWYYKWKFDRWRANGVKNKAKLAKKYKDIVYELNDEH